MSGKELKKEFGDYQTPDYFAERVCKLLRDVLCLSPDTVIEPTSGIGNFLNAALVAFPEVSKAVGIEINNDYCEQSKCRIDDERLEIINDNFFSYPIEKHIEGEEVLFIGNPPWATNSDLNFNLPEKENFKKLNGTDAITGSSNFDICEYIILKLIEKSVGKNVSIAMLCKTSVARNVLLEIDRNNVKVDCIKLYNFNSQKVFDISASACLLYIKMSISNNECRDCEVFDMDYPENVKEHIVFSEGKLRNSNNLSELEGICEIEWRQGVKHDCSSVMELVHIDKNLYQNKSKEMVELEPCLVFPLIKSSAFKKPIMCSNFNKYVIVTQKKVREDTAYIENLAPKTWKYLCSKKASFDNRKSSIYKGAPAFSMFGVGEYSYADYKVGVSGFYKKPLFSLLYNQDSDQPVMVDDTAYFLSFSSFDDAYTCMLLLNTSKVQDFLYSISFKDAKRPYTKKVLQRLELKKCVEKISFYELIETERMLGLINRITEEMYNSFSKCLS